MLLFAWQKANDARLRRVRGQGRMRGRRTAFFVFPEKKIILSRASESVAFSARVCYTGIKSGVVFQGDAVPGKNRSPETEKRRKAAGKG